MTTTDARDLERTRSPARRRLHAALPLAERLALPVIVLAAAGFAAYYALDIDEWRVMSDELMYLRLALHMGDTLSPLPEIHGAHIAVYNLLYSLLLAPIVELFDLPTAIHVAHALNTLLFASAAIPAFLLTRWLLPSRLAPPAVAALTVLVPWLAFTFSLLTEVVAYPAIVWAVYAIVRTVAEPSMRRDVIALVAIAVAYFARTQFVFLAAVLPAAIAVQGIAYPLAERAPGRWERIRRGAIDAVAGHPLVWGAAVLGAMVLLAGENVYGSYNAFVNQSDLWPAGTGAALIDHVNQIAVGAAVLPLPLTVAFTLTTLVRPAGDRRAHAFAVVLLIALPAIALIATTFDQTFGGRFPQERYIFYVVPFLFVGTAMCLLGRRPSPVTMLGSAVATAVLLLQTEYVPVQFPPYASPTKFAYPAIDYRAHWLGDAFGFADLQAAPLFAGGALLAVAALAFLVHRGRARTAFVVAACALGIWGIALARYAMPRAMLEHNNYAAVLVGSNRPDDARNWIDRATPGGASVGMVPSPVNERGGKPMMAGEVDQAVWWDPEYWNKRVDRMLQLPGTPSYTPFPKVALTIARRTGALRPGSGGMPTHLLLARSDVRFAPQASGRAVTSGDLALYALKSPTRAAWATWGVTPYGFFDPGDGATLTLYPLGRDRVARRVTLLLGRGRSDRGRFRVTAPGVRLGGRMRATREVSFTPCVGPRPWSARIRLTHTAKPRIVEVRDAPGGTCRPSGKGGR